uniref:Uncharacterized protein n=1 Tax=Neogobius melanostomus TaxID=47308 RepID=A0A8C6SM49_9GOBI
MKIASFNVQRFGESKVSKPDVLSTLVKISGTSITVINIIDLSLRFCKTRQIQYKSQLSARLGRSTYKEQFLFLYRDYVELTHSYQYKDNKADNPDVFAREPYILHFKPRNTVLEDIVLIPVHTTPEDSKNELNALHAVSMVVRKKWNTDVCGFISGVLSKHNDPGRFQCRWSLCHKEKMKKIMEVELRRRSPPQEAQK